LQEGAIVKCYDPEAMDNVQKIFKSKIIFCEDEYEAVEKADALMIMTEWPVFRTPDFELLENKLNNKAIFDGRNLYDVEEMKERGFTYSSIGRTFVN